MEETNSERTTDIERDARKNIKAIYILLLLWYNININGGISMKDKLSFAMSFVGKKIVFDVGWFDYSTGIVKSVETTESNGYPKIKLVVEDILSYDSTHRDGRTLNWSSIDRALLLTDYLNYHRQRWGMWAVADSKAGKDLVQRIERKWDRKPKPEYNPCGNPNLLEKKQAKYYNLVKEHQSAGLPIWIRTKYRAADTEYKLVKAEADEYKLTIQNEKAFIDCWRASYAQKVKVTNLGRKYFFTEEEGLNSLK